MPTHDPIQDYERTARSTAYVQLAICRDGYVTADPLERFCHAGYARYSHHAKSAIDSMRSDDDGVAYSPLATAMLGQVKPEALDGQMRGITRIPLTQTARIAITNAVGSTVAETAAKPVTHLAFEFVGPASKVVALTVGTAEFFRSLDPTSQEMLRQQVVTATVAARNAAFVAALTAGAPTAASSAAALFASVSAGSPRFPTLIGGFDSLATLPSGAVRDLQALGVVILTAPEAQGLLIACDGAGILMSDDPIRIAMARHASIDLSDTPGAGSLTSLWQSDQLALRSEQYLRIGVRPDASAWTNTGTP